MAGGFGSCHSFGVAGVCAAMACAKSVGENLSEVAVRWADIVRIYVRSRVLSFNFSFSVPRCLKKRELSAWRI